MFDNNQRQSDDLLDDLIDNGNSGLIPVDPTNTNGDNPPAPNSTTGNNTSPPVPPVDPALDLKTVFEQQVDLFRADESTLSAEDASYKESLLSLFKGKTVDEKGNMLNEEGKIVLPADKFKHYIETEEIELDAEGNEVNALGEIIRTAAEIEEANTLVSPLRKRIEQEFGIEVKGDFEDTEEGLIELVNTAIKTSNTTIVKDFLESEPELYSIYKHLKSGKTLEDYAPKFIDYKAINLKEIDDATKLGYVKTMLQKQGLPNADNIVELIKTAGADEIAKQASQAILFLDQKQALERQEEEAAFRAKEEQEKLDTKKYWNEVTTLIDKGIIGNINIPVQERQAFKDYLSKPVTKEGLSEDMVRAAKETTESALLISYLRYKGGDISKLATIVANTKRTQTLRQRFDTQSGKEARNGGTYNAQRTQKINPSDVSLDNMNF